MDWLVASSSWRRFFRWIYTPSVPLKVNGFVKARHLGGTADLRSRFVGWSISWLKNWFSEARESWNDRGPDLGKIEQIRLDACFESGRKLNITINLKQLVQISGDFIFDRERWKLNRSQIYLRYCSSSLCAPVSTAPISLSCFVGKVQDVCNLNFLVLLLF